jgi:hypothetical protein
MPHYLAFACVLAPDALADREPIIGVWGLPALLGSC